MQDIYTDNQLLEMIARQSETALTILYERYYTLLCTAAFKKLPDEPIVEELVQDVFVNIWEKAARLDTEGNVKAYLFATLRNKVLHELRSRMVIANYAATVIKEEHYANDASELLQAKQLEQKLNLVIQELPPQCREAFTLSRFEQLSYKLIAARMNVSVNTVEKHIGKAPSIIRKEVKELDVIISIMFFIIHSF